jgi:uncharacterized protein YggE
MHRTRQVEGGLALVALLYTPLLAQQQTQSPTAVITTSGVAEVVIPPEWVLLRFGVSARDSTAAAASDRGQHLLDRVIDTLLALRVSRDSLQTVELQVGPNRDYAGERRIIDYEAQAVVRVVLHDLDKLGGVIGAALRAGATTIPDITFQSAREPEARRRAFALAFEEARRDADAIARATGGTVGPLIEVTTVPRGFLPSEMYEAAGFSAPQGQVAPRDVVIHVALTARWNIQPAR